MMTGDRPVVIEVGGICQGMPHRSSYRIKVPYSNLSNAMQSVTRRGGKILHVAIGNSAIDRENSPSTSDLASERISNRTPDLTPDPTPDPKPVLTMAQDFPGSQPSKKSQLSKKSQPSKRSQTTSGKGFQIKKK